jgi:hypothetical protein
VSTDKQLPAVLKNEQGKGLQINTIDDLKSVAGLFLQSGIFEDLKGGPEQAMAQAAVKVMAGQELGISPFAAMRGIHLIKGKPTPSYQMIGAIIKRSPRHDYKVLKSTAEVAEIEFFCDGKSQGISKFDTADMQRAGLGGDSWRKYPTQMRFARAMTQGANLFIPEVFAGSIYTPEEMGADVDDEGNPITDAQEVQAEPQKKPNGKASSSKNVSSAKNSQTTTNESASDAGKTSTPPKESQPSDSPSQNAPSEEQEPTDAEVVHEAAASPPGAEVIDQILQAAVSNGWTTDQVESWIGEFLAANNVEVTESMDEGEIAAAMGWDLVTAALNHVSSSKPE